MGSAVDEDNLRWNLEQLADKGIGTVEITPIYGVQGNGNKNVPFLSDRWMDLLRFCIEEGNRLGIQVDMTCGTGWPFGGAEVPLSEAACKLVVKDTVVSKKEVKSLLLEAPPAERAYARRILQRDFPADDLTRRRVIALFESRTRQKVKRAAPGSEGWVIDHFDSAAVAHYLQRIDDAFAKTGTPWPATFFNDSYEVYGADWTPTLLAEFAKRRGYRLEDRLPAFIDGEADIISDYRETLGELLLENFTEQWTRWAHSHGVRVRNQAHGSPANLIDIYAAVDIPEIEGFGLTDFGIRGLRRDSMTRKNDSDFSMLKYASSAAHITGKPLTSAESCTWLTEHFRTSLSQIKPDLDLMFCAGVNRMLFHGTCFSPKNEPWPGWQFYASVDMSPTNSIWRDAGYLMQYIGLCQQFLQWGQPDNDFLVYLPVRDMWHKMTDKRLMQFDIHSMGKKAGDFISTILTIDSLGFDCDYISERYLLKTTFNGECLQTAAGTSYRAIIIPGNCLMTDAVRQHLKRLETEGACIIYQLSVERLRQAAQPEALKTLCGLKLIRRKESGSYHYFIANLSPQDVDAYVSLAVPFTSAKWINPLAGNTPQTAEIRDGQLRVRLRSGESRLLTTDCDSPAPTMFNLERESSGVLLSDNNISSSDESETIAIQGEREDGQPFWRLSFIDSTPAVSQTYNLDSLQTWESLDTNTAGLMGTGVYECTFRLNTEFQAKRVWQLNLGDVRESARVSINGVNIGCAWAAPFVLDIPPGTLRTGSNTLRIEVTNLPANRIAALDREGFPWRRFEDINIVDINYRRSSYAGWKPVPSGLKGPITIMALGKNLTPDPSPVGEGRE
ncbi:MAG: glycosyl hydrolase family 2 [Bacteroidaceae bacterium]|nr:glycosyl hydrolase family 2 [Bacteroidaceae bacterium]